MRVLFISNDTTLFDRKSPAHLRMKAYATAIGELHVLSRSTNKIEIQDGNLHLYGLRSFPTIIGRTLFLYALIRHARVLLCRHHIEVVSAQDPFEHGLVASRAVLKTSAKLHIQIHTDFLSPYFAKESYKNSMRVRIADKILPKANGIRVVSKRIKLRLIKRYGNNIVKPNIIPIISTAHVTNDVYSPLLQKYPFTFMLMAVGRLEKEKRLADAINVVASLIKKKYPVGLIIVGDGKEHEHLVAMAHKLGIDSHIIFLGQQQNISELLTRANAFIQTSAYEGYGRTYIEAALAGAPMVVTDAGIMGEVFVHGESALICPVGDIKCLISQVAHLIEDNGLRRTISERARIVAQEHIDNFRDLPAHIASDFESLKNSK